MILSSSDCSLKSNGKQNIEYNTANSVTATIRSYARMTNNERESNDTWKRNIQSSSRIFVLFEQPPSADFCESGKIVGEKRVSPFCEEPLFLLKQAQLNN